MGAASGSRTDWDRTERNGVGESARSVHLHRMHRHCGGSRGEHTNETASSTTQSLDSLLMRRFAGLLVSVLVVSGCGGDGASDAGAVGRPGISSDAEAPASTTTTIEAPPDETALAEKVRVQLSDLPTGFREVGNDGKDTGNVSDQFDRCFAKSRAKFGTLTGEAVFYGFDSENKGNVGSAAVVALDDAAAQTVTATLEGAEFLDCFREGVKEGLKSAANTTEFEAGDVRGGKPSFPNMADQTLAYQIVAEFSSKGFDGKAYVDLVVVRRGRSIGILMFSDILSSFDEEQREQIVSKVVARM